MASDQRSEQEAALARDRRLLAAWRAGDEGSGLELLENYLPFFRSLCWRYGIDQEDEQVDLFQDVSLRILQVLPKLSLDSSFAGYLRKVLITALRSLRKNSDHTTLPPDVAEPPRSDPLEGSETRSALFECRRSLEQRELCVFDGRIFDETEFSVLAAQIGVTLNNLYVLYHRARQKIRDCMEGKGFRVDSS